MVMGHDDVSDGSPGQCPGVRRDGRRFHERRTAIDQQRCPQSLDQTDGDVEKRQAASVHTVGKGFPVVLHQNEGSRG